MSYKAYANVTTPTCAGSHLGLDGTARHKHACFSHTTFYADAANGTLPAFSYIMPPTEACDHPCYDMAKGERLVKDIYEALRAGPGWEDTMFFVAYDDGGGFYDHVLSDMVRSASPPLPMFARVLFVLSLHVSLRHCADDIMRTCHRRACPTPSRAAACRPAARTTPSISGGWASAWPRF